jgi:AcrR family transcriptional regulator
VDTKERIRRKAAQLFARNGYQATGVQEISDAVGLGRGALYHHIGSKEALLEDICAPLAAAMIEVAQALLEADLPAPEKIRRLSRAQMRALADHLPEWTVFQRDAATLRGPVARRILELRKRYEDVCEEIFREGVDAGAFRSVDRLAIKGMLGMHNYAYMWLDPRGRLSPEEVADVFCDVLLEGLRRRG